MGLPMLMRNDTLEGALPFRQKGACLYIDAGTPIPAKNGELSHSTQVHSQPRQLCGSPKGRASPSQFDNRTHNSPARPSAHLASSARTPKTKGRLLSPGAILDGADNSNPRLSHAKSCAGGEELPANARPDAQNGHLRSTWELCRQPLVSAHGELFSLNVPLTRWLGPLRG